MKRKDPIELYRDIAGESRPGGGLAEPTQHIWNSILSFQGNSLKETGHAAEIGVWYGYGSGFVLGHLAESEKLFLIDKFVSWAQFGPTLEHFADDAKERMHLLREDSKLVELEDVDEEFRQGCRFIHIDGEHSYEAVISDLALTEQLLSPKGVLVVDDVLNHLCPQVTHALFEYIDKSDTLKLLMFAFNKAYLVRKDCFDAYQQWLIDTFVTPETPLIDVTVSFGSKTGVKSYCSLLPRSGKRFIYVDKSFNVADEFPLEEFLEGSRRV